MLGVVSGIVLSLALFVPLFVAERRNKFEFGVNQGFAHGLNEAATRLQTEFGEYAGNGDYKRIFSISTSDVIAIEINGVKTVRVIP